MTDVTSTLLLAGFKRRYERLAQQQRAALVALRSAKHALTEADPRTPGDGPAQTHAMALALVINTIGVIEAGEQSTTIAEEVSARIEEPGRPKMPFSPARGALGCLAVACVLSVYAAIVFGAMGLLWNDPWRFGWLAIAIGAASVLVWVALYRRSHRGRDL